MKFILGTLAMLAACALIGGAAFIYFGVFNVAASEPHSSAVYWVMETARVRSIKMHAAGIAAPAGWDAPDNLPMAAAHFSAHCAVCHGAPGAKRSAIAQGMYPAPPELTHVGGRYAPAELFWILKNGIKMSGMPSMADDGDQMLWSTVALLEKLPSLSDDDYNDLWLASQAQAEGHEGSMAMGGMNMRGVAPAAPRLASPDAMHHQEGNQR